MEGLLRRPPTQKVRVAVLGMLPMRGMEWNSVLWDAVDKVRSILAEADNGKQVHLETVDLMYQFFQGHPVCKMASNDCSVAILDECHLLKPMSPIEDLGSFDFDLIISVIFLHSFHLFSV